MHGLNVDSIKTRIETLLTLADKGGFVGLNVDSIKTRIETIVYGFRRSTARRLNVDSIKTRIETCRLFSVPLPCTIV